MASVNVTSVIKSALRAYDYRCRSCGRFLFRAALAPGSNVQTRCPKCGQMHSTKYTNGNSQDVKTGT